VRRSRHREKQRLLWDGRYKPYYVILGLDEIDLDRKINEDELMRRWWGFLD
jgi:hypothetical protein